MPATITPLLPKKDTLSAQVTRYLLDHIAAEALKPGDIVPSEASISRNLNISRGIVREAYRALATLGILQIEAGKQPRVRGLSSTVLTQLLSFALCPLDLHCAAQWRSRGHGWQRKTERQRSLNG